MKRLEEVLAGHRVSYHHRNVGPEPVTSANLRYTSCDGCDWLGGRNDEAGWEAHLADVVLAWVAARLDGARPKVADAIVAYEDSTGGLDDTSVDGYTDAALAVVRKALGVPQEATGAAVSDEGRSVGFGDGSDDEGGL